MSIMIYPLANLLALVSQLLQPVDGRPFTDAAILSQELQCGQDDSVYMLTQLLWCNGSKILSSKVRANFVKNSLVIKQCVLTIALRAEGACDKEGKPHFFGFDVRGNHHSVFPSVLQ